MPRIAALGFTAVDKKAFYKLSEEDQAIVREVMERMYRDFDKANIVDNLGARDAMLKTGIETVSLEVSDFDKVRESMMELNASLADQGELSKELYDEMLGYIEEYRSEHQAEAGSAN